MSETLVINEIYISLQGESTWAGLPCIFLRLTACDLRCSYCDTVYAFTEGKRQSFEEILARVGELAAPYQYSAGTPGGGTGPTGAKGTPGEGTGPTGAKGTPGEGTGPTGAKGTPGEGTGPTGARLAGIGGRLPLVELTGGEPLLQRNSVPLMKLLCDAGYTVLLETSGAHDIATVDARVHRIMDLKCPSSGESGRNRRENLAHLKATDEIKFVIGTQEDYAWMKAQIRTYNLAGVCPLLCSWVHPLTAEQGSPVLKRVPAEHTPISRKELAERIIADALPVRFQAQLHKIIWPPEQRGV